jgi:hypothetical protein
MAGLRINRRGFCLSAASAAATRSMFARSLNSFGLSVSASSAIALDSGINRMALVPGDRGYGIEIFTLDSGFERRVAISLTPVIVFYGRRISGHLTQVAFEEAARDRKGLIARASFSDTQSNRWRVRFTAETCQNSGFRFRFDCRLISGSASNFFFELPFFPAIPASPEQTYVLLPGLLYDGNRLTRPTFQIPQFTAAEDCTVDTPVLTLSTPVAAFQDKQTGLTFMYVTEPTTDLSVDMAGFRCVALPQSLSIAVTAPCYREKHYHHNHYEPKLPKGASLSPGGAFSVTTAVFAGVYPDRLALFRALQPIRGFVRKPFRRSKTLPMSAAADLVQSNLNLRQWCETGFYANAINPDYSIAKLGCSHLGPGWQLQTGWCSGAMTGYALLKMDDKTSQRRARAMLDLICKEGISPSGLIWSDYADGNWDPARNNSDFYQHMRMPADVTFYLLKALELERERGLAHPAWLAAAGSNLDAFTRLWREHQDFGHKVDRFTLAVTSPGTSAGALCIGGLALGAKLPRGSQYLKVACAAADAYFERAVKTGWIVAGPLDIPNAPDSESPTALLESYVTLYEVTHDTKYLGYAQETAYHLATWIVSYNAPFPAGTRCDQLGIQTVGGVLANSQNHHIGPSFCTNSGSALLRLHRYTGDTIWLRLLEDVLSGLPQYVCSGQPAWKLMKPGMVTEQFDMSDELMARGDAWEVSASWSATCVLLSFGDVPSIYIDKDRKVIGVFDQIEARPDWRARKLSISNPTGFSAKVRVMNQDGESKSIVVQARESRVEVF